MEQSPVIEQALIALGTVQDAASRALMTEKEHQIVRANGEDLRKFLATIRLSENSEVDKNA